MLLTATLAPETVTADVPVRDVPVKVTFTAAPREPEFGETAVRVGALAVDANSTAPTSTAPFDFRRVPKKSSPGAALIATGEARGDVVDSRRTSCQRVVADRRLGWTDWFPKSG